MSDSFEAGIDSRARTSDVVIEILSSRASITVKGQWFALWPVGLQMRRASVEAVR